MAFSTLPATLERPIFVVGAPRSGTTLVQCIVSASAEAFSLPETHFFSMVLPEIGGRSDAPLSADQVRQARDVLAREAEIPLDDSFWNDFQRPDLTARALFVALVDAFRPDDPARHLRLVEKTPLHVEHLDAIGAAFPDAAFVHVVRGPVDVVSSWRASPFAVSRSVLEYARAWERVVLAGERYAAAHPDRVHTLVYERMVREPEPTVRGLCAFLGLPYEDRLLQEFGREAGRNVGGSETWKRDVQAGVLLNREGIWRQRLTPGQAWIAARATRRTAARFGLAAAPSASPRSIISALADEVRVRYREARATHTIILSARHALYVLRAAGTRAN